MINDRLTIEENEIFRTPLEHKDDHDLLVTVATGQRWIYAEVKEIKERIKESNGTLREHETRIVTIETRFKFIWAIMGVIGAGIIPIVVMVL